MKGIYCAIELLEEKNKEIRELKAKYENAIKILKNKKNLDVMT